MAVHIIIVCGYGPELTYSIKEYLDDVIAFCQFQKTQPDVILFSGGCSRKKTLPDLSEARSMMNYVESQLDGGPFPQLRFLDEESLTTMENIKNAQKILSDSDFLLRKTRVTIFCNARKKFIIKHLARHFFGQTTVVIEPIEWDLDDGLFMQLLVNVYTLAALHFPSLAALYRNIRVKQFATM